MYLNEILNRLRKVQGGNGQYSACCPAHDDKRASLRISESEGKILLHCHAGCSLEKITSALGISTADLFTEPRTNTVTASNIEYIYTDINGNKILKKVRTPDKKFYWLYLDDKNQWQKGRNGMTAPIYNQCQVKDAKGLYIVEGEKDVETLQRLGQAAVSLPDGAKTKWNDEYIDFFKDKHIAIIPDNDTPGKEYAQMIADKICDIAKVRIVDLTKLWEDMPEHSDITDYISKHGKESIKNVYELAKKTPIYKRKVNGLSCLTDVNATSSEWLWYPYIPQGKITLLTADPGIGKTFFSLYLTATVSTGRPFWGQNIGREPRTVIYQTAEDGIADTIKPRLEPMQPNFNNIYFINEDEKPLNLLDERIEDTLKAQHPALMIFDPLQAYLGANVDMHRANEVRPIMARIANLAEKYGTAFIFIMHNSKMGQNQALYRALGSIDIPAIARSMLIMANNRENEGQKLVCHEKNSLAEHGKTITFRIAPDKGGLLFEGFTDLKADDVLNPHSNTRNKPSVKKDDVTEKLIQLLEENNGAVSMEQIEEFKEAEGIKDRTLYRARKELDINTVSIGFNPKRTWWLLPYINIEEFKKKINPIPEQTTFNE